MIDLHATLNLKESRCEMTAHGISDLARAIGEYEPFHHELCPQCQTIHISFETPCTDRHT